MFGDVRFGSKADSRSAATHVRFGSKADMCDAQAYVRYRANSRMTCTIPWHTSAHNIGFLNKGDAIASGISLQE
jgi:hypothetical protein